MDGEYRLKINIELTETEASCLLSQVLSMDEMSKDHPQNGHSELAAMVFSRLVGAFPSLMKNDKAISFFEQYRHGNGNGNGYDHDYENVPNDMAMVIWDRVVLERVEQHLQARRKFINAELSKLDSRRKFIESCYIKQVLEERSCINERHRLSEIWRRLGANAEYKFIKERMHQLKSELAKISCEIAELLKTFQSNHQGLSPVGDV